MTRPASATITLWDWPVRLCHWAMVALIAGLWASQELGRLDWHVRLGMAMLFVVAFRLAWGLIGGETARFARFVKGPAAIRAYWRGDAPPVIGHNPLGALSVVAMLALLSAQIVAGLFATDTDAIHYGPLNAMVGYDTAALLTRLHHLGFNLLLGLIALHLLAIGYYAVVRKDRLVPPMITGRKTYPHAVAQPAGAPLWRLALALLIAFAVCDWVWNGGHWLPQPKPAYDISY